MTKTSSKFGRLRDEVACWLVLLALNGIATPWYQRMIADALAADPSRREMRLSRPEGPRY